MKWLGMAPLGLAACALLAGCGDSDRDDLNAWMKQQQTQAHPRVTPIAEPKRFTPQPYTEGAATEPFNIMKLTEALRHDSAQPELSGLIAPELTRRKEALEAFPLDSMKMVGSMIRNGHPVGLISVDKLLYQVRVGEHIGLNYGRITAISETGLDLREIVQDAAGEWIERMTKLELQERSEKSK